MKKIKVFILALSVMIVCNLSACAALPFEIVMKEDADTTSAEGSEETMIEDSEEPIIEDTEEPVIEDTEELINEDTVEPVTEDTEEPNVEDSDTTTTQSNDTAALEDMAWEDMALTIDGVMFDLPADYSLFVDNGWSFDLAEYGYENGYVLNGGGSIFMTIYLENEAYESDITVGFENFTTEVKDVTECSIPDLRISILFADTYPEVVLPGGITWGSTLEEVLAAYGDGYEGDPYRADSLSYTVYEYAIDYTTRMKLIIHDDLGLVEVTLQQ